MSEKRINSVFQSEVKAKVKASAGSWGSRATRCSSLRRPSLSSWKRLTAPAIKVCLGPQDGRSTVDFRTTILSDF